MQNREIMGRGEEKVGEKGVFVYNKEFKCAKIMVLTFWTK
jgi:hypothetical protein